MGTPFQRAANFYLAEGWSPIPLPEKSKWPPADGYTGANGTWVDADDIIKWCKPRGRAQAGNMNFRPGNIALRLPKGVLGIDADMYEGKAGRATLESAETAWGPLPPTWVSGSREDGSGIRLYRIPEGLSWPGQLPQGGGVELVRWDHRYCICAPSIHDKTGEEYVWRLEVEELEAGTDEVFVRMAARPEEFPSVGDLPDLPTTWVEGLTSGKPWVDRGERVELSATAVRDWLSARNGPAHCEVMRKTFNRGLATVRRAGDDGGAHDAARDAAWALIGDAASGHAGVAKALQGIREAFKVAVAERRASTWRDEWGRIVSRGVEKVAAEGDSEGEDTCEAIESAAPPGGKAPTGSAMFDFIRDDRGNGDRFLVRYADDAKYCLGLGGWQTWNGSVWDADLEALTALDWAGVLVRDMSEEAAFIEDPKEKAAFVKFVRASGSQGRLRAMIDNARRGKALLNASEFDANPRLLNCEGSTVELSPSGVRVRGVRRDDYCRLTTGVRYVPDAQHGAWTKFLERFLPLPEERAWAQKLVAYSLMGANPARVLVIAKGPTTSGKSTFAEAIMGALGVYAGPFGLTLFRDNQDERPRVDIVQALPRRLIIAEEASKEWHLHADQVKRATGGSRWGARGLFGKGYVERVPAFTPWIVTNNTPTVLGADAAFRKRLRALPFNVQVDTASENVGYKELLAMRDVREAILAWAVAGWAMYLEDETLTDMPHGAAELAMRIGDELSEFDECLHDISEAGDASYRAEVGALYLAYQIWVGQNGDERKILTQNAFSREMTGKGYGRDQSKDGGKTTRWRTGLRLREEWARLQ